MSSAVVDAFLHTGTMLYAVTYVAPDVQAAATVTYPANGYVQDLIQTNPNIIASAVTALERANRKWFDSIPDPQPQQPLAVVPAPSVPGTSAPIEAKTEGAGSTGGAGSSDGTETTGSTGTPGSTETTGLGEGL